MKIKDKIVQIENALSSIEDKCDIKIKHQFSLNKNHCDSTISQVIRYGVAEYIDIKHTLYHVFTIDINLGNPLNFDNFNFYNNAIKTAVNRMRCDSNDIIMSFAGYNIIRITLFFKITEIKNLTDIEDSIRLFNEYKCDVKASLIAEYNSSTDNISLYLSSEDKTYNENLLKKLFGKNCIKKCYNNREEAYIDNPYIKNKNYTIIAEIKYEE
jgi:hypothetical protein